MSGSEPCHHASNLQPQPNPNASPSRDSGQVQQPGDSEAEGFAGFPGSLPSPWERQRLCKMVEGSQRRAGPLLIFRKDLCQQTHCSLSSDLPGLLRESTVFSLPSAPSPARSSPLQAGWPSTGTPPPPAPPAALCPSLCLWPSLSTELFVFLHGLERPRAQFQRHLLCKASSRRSSAPPGALRVPPRGCGSPGRSPLG